MVKGFATQVSARESGRLTRSAIAQAAAGNNCVGVGMNAQNKPTPNAPDTE